MVSPVHGLNVPAHVLVTGASSGIGLAIVEALLDDASVARVCAVSRHAADSDALARLHARHGSRLQPIPADLTSDAGIDAIVEGVRAGGDDLHLLVNCAGVLHGEGLLPEKSLASLDRDALERSFALNAFAPVLLVRALLPLLGPGAPRVVASLSARVGSISDNRLGGWYAYRAAKAAQNQLLRTLAIEWHARIRTRPACCCIREPWTRRCRSHSRHESRPMRCSRPHAPRASCWTSSPGLPQQTAVVSLPGTAARFRGERAGLAPRPAPATSIARYR